MAEAKKERNKIYAVGVVGFLAILSILYYMSAPVYLYIVVYMWFGFLYGVLQQYGRFCFASAWRDLIMVKVPRMFVGIMIGLMTSQHHLRLALHSSIPNFYPHGARLGRTSSSAACCSAWAWCSPVVARPASLYKTGEGNMISLTVLLSLSFAQAIFVSLPFFDSIIETVHPEPANQLAG